MPWPPHALPAVLAKLESGDVTPLLTLASTDNPAEEVVALSTSDVERLWKAATPIVEAALEAAEPAMQPGGNVAEEMDEALASAIEALHAVAIVAVHGGRPPLPTDAPPTVTSLIARCWSEDTEARPTFEEVEALLLTIRDSLGEEEELWLDEPNGHRVYSEQAQ